MLVFANRLLKAYSSLASSRVQTSHQCFLIPKTVTRIIQANYCCAGSGSAAIAATLPAIPWSPWQLLAITALYFRPILMGTGHGTFACSRIQLQRPFACCDAKVAWMASDFSWVHLNAIEVHLRCQQLEMRVVIAFLVVWIFQVPMNSSEVIADLLVTQIYWYWVHACYLDCY